MYAVNFRLYALGLYNFVDLSGVFGRLINGGLITGIQKSISKQATYSRADQNTV